MNEGNEKSDNIISQTEKVEGSPEKEETQKDKYLDYELITRRWRVKLYKLNEIGQWDDKGIGNAFCATKKEDNDIVQNKLMMINEKTEEEMINLDINKDQIEFHNQRGTIMTWRMGGDSGDDNIAMSFQEKEGVAEIVKTILIWEGKDANIEDLYMEFQDDGFLEVSIQNLPNLEKELNSDMGEQKLNIFIDNLKKDDYSFIMQLGDLLKEEEKKIENLKTTISSNLMSSNFSYTGIQYNNEYNQQQIYKNLPMRNIKYIFDIFKNLILIGDKELIEILINDENYLITFGALEYDFETMKSVPHRKYFKDIVKFKNPLNINDDDILKKIDQNIRLTYLRDTALSRIIDDNSIKTINLILQLNYNDIIQFFLNDNNKYLDTLLNQLESKDINVQKESCLFLLELIECSKNVIQSKATFNECLFEKGILNIICKILIENQTDKNDDIYEFIKISLIEIFINILTSIPNLILDFLKKEEDHQLLKLLINIMLYSDKFGLKYEICQIYKTLIEIQMKEQNSDIMEFYDESLTILLKYLNVPMNPNIPHQNKLVISSTKQLIIEILITWFSLMNFNKQFWIEENKLNEIIYNLLGEDDKTVNLYTIKLLKCLIESTDHFVCDKILTQKICQNLSNLFNDNIKKHNILISCIIDFYETLSKSKEKIFINIMSFNSDFFYQHKKYFNLIILRYENKELPKKQLINYLTGDYKENESLLLGEFDYKGMGEYYCDEDKDIDFLNKKGIIPDLRVNEKNNDGGNEF